MRGMEKEGTGFEKHFPKAHITLDRFHLMKELNEAVDEVRREEAKTRPELSKSRYVWLKNLENLRQGQWDSTRQKKSYIWSRVDGSFGSA